MNRTCEECGEALTSSRQKKYCSKDCSRLAAQFRYYQTHKVEYTQRREQWRKDNPVRTKYLYARADIKRRDRGGLSITYEECQLLWAMGCSYCGKDVLIEKGCSLDRLDNSLGYLLSNVVTCCGDCNTIKSDILTFDEMKVAMRAILDFRNNQ